ncbi:maleylacetate reductase [Quadrisphaera granulorum]|uniref:Maleylacetate reductase n=1 Tax=Quadrisphaera granulorum TaxID=317664 RepID=A0A315ZJW5_9ACTN|nr:maleylacetate reductase [Quadrisphaera granulorum]PWJ45776.1 maleylacetate reductase [Quadrisphaera granulorum]SZE99135.1 maleylacetate reductase [Quadrisphaera granulorum]
MSGAQSDVPSPGLTSFDHTSLGQRVLFGSHRAAENIARAVTDLGAQRVLVVAGRSSALVAGDVTRALPVVASIDEVAQHVPAERAAAAVEVAESSGADLVVTIGGGSATGLGKAVALHTGLPLVAIPTTFAGSEATDVWGITTDGVKKTGSDPRVLPRAVVYDAALTLGLPRGSVAVSSLNAVAHGVDGLWAPRADPINRALSTEGLRTLVPALQRLAQAGSQDDDEAGGQLALREQLLHGAHLTAVAFASAGSGLHHKVCHVLGGAFGLPHAEMHAIVLPHVTAFNAPAAPDAAARLAELFDGVPAATGLRQLLADLGGPQALRDVGLTERDLRRAAELVLPNVPPSNPRPVDVDALEALLRAAWAGDPVTEEGADR